MKFKVRKGLETDLKIKGMTAKYFYVYCGIGGALIIIALSAFMGAVHGGSFIGFVGLLIILGIVFVIVRIVLMNMSRTDKLRKYKNDRKTIIVSNRDILKWK
jgi:hypothetical protein